MARTNMKVAKMAMIPTRLPLPITTRSTQMLASQKMIILEFKKIWVTSLRPNKLMRFLMSTSKPQKRKSKLFNHKTAG